MSLFRRSAPPGFVRARSTHVTGNHYAAGRSRNGGGYNRRFHNRFFQGTLWFKARFGCVLLYLRLRHSLFGVHDAQFQLFLPPRRRFCSRSRFLRLALRYARHIRNELFLRHRLYICRKTALRARSRHPFGQTRRPLRALPRRRGKVLRLSRKGAFFALQSLVKVHILIIPSAPRRGIRAYTVKLWHGSFAIRYFRCTFFYALTTFIF